MTEGFRSRHPCLVCAMQHGSTAVGGESDERERGEGERREETRKREREEKRHRVGGGRGWLKGGRHEGWEGARGDERGGEGESEEEREDIDRTCSRATRPPSPCQASWKEREARSDCSFSLPSLPPSIPSTLPMLVFFRDGSVTLSSDTRGYTGCRAPLVPLPSPRSAPLFCLTRPVRLCPSQRWHGWVPKKRRKKPLETSRLAQKTTTATVATTAAAAATIATSSTPLPSKNHTPPAHVCQLRAETP